MTCDNSRLVSKHINMYHSIWSFRLKKFTICVIHEYLFDVCSLFAFRQLIALLYAREIFLNFTFIQLKQQTLNVCDLRRLGLFFYRMPQPASIFAYYHWLFCIIPIQERREYFEIGFSSDWATRLIKREFRINYACWLYILRHRHIRIFAIFFSPLFVAIIECFVLSEN